MLFSFGLVAGLLRALWVSARERYLLGVGAAVIRLALLALALREVTRSWGPLVPSAPTRGLLFADLCNLVGPMITIGTVVLTYRRFIDVPAAQEEKAQRPFRAWLFPAVIDAIMLVILIGAVVVSLGV